MEMDLDSSIGRETDRQTHTHTEKQSAVEEKAHGLRERGRCRGEGAGIERDKR